MVQVEIRNTFRDSIAEGVPHSFSPTRRDHNFCMGVLHLGFAREALHTQSLHTVIAKNDRKGYAGMDSLAATHNTGPRRPRRVNWDQLDHPTTPEHYKIQLKGPQKLRPSRALLWYPASFESQQK